jgi:hypothetical protein
MLQHGELHARCSFIATKYFSTVPRRNHCHHERTAFEKNHIIMCREYVAFTSSRVFAQVTQFLKKLSS